MYVPAERFHTNGRSTIAGNVLQMTSGTERFVFYFAETSADITAETLYVEFTRL